jgi:guanylate kinase
MKYLPTDIRPVFILPPDFQTWLERMEKQGPINLDERKRRLHSAKAELREVLKNESYLVFINSEISITAHQITSKVADAKLQDQNRQVAGQLLDDIRDY